MSYLTLLALLLTGQVDGLHLHVDDAHAGQADIHVSSDAHLLDADNDHPSLPVVNLGAQDDLRSLQPDDDLPFVPASANVPTPPPAHGPPPQARAWIAACPSCTPRLPPSRAPPAIS